MRIIECELNVLGRMWKEAAIGNFKVPSWHFMDGQTNMKNLRQASKQVRAESANRNLQNTKQMRYTVHHSISRDKDSQWL
jgi:hypothetical protein